MHGLCPKCQKPVMRANLGEITSSVPMGTQWKTITFNCPMCRTILGVQIDPIAIRTEIINALKRR